MIYIKVGSRDYRITPFASQILIEQVTSSFDIPFVIKTVGYYSAWEYKTLSNVESLIIKHCGYNHV